jgi:hypothetical protein
VYLGGLVSSFPDFSPIKKTFVMKFQCFPDVEIHSVMHFLWLRGASGEQIMSQIKENV